MEKKMFIYLARDGDHQGPAFRTLYAAREYVMKEWIDKKWVERRDNIWTCGNEVIRIDKITLR